MTDVQKWPLSTKMNNPSCTNLLLFKIVTCSPKLNKLMTAITSSARTCGAGLAALGVPAQLPRRAGGHLPCAWAKGAVDGLPGGGRTGLARYPRRCADAGAPGSQQTGHYRAAGQRARHPPVADLRAGASPLPTLRG